MKPLLLLDRDGVINDRPIPPERYILNLNQLKIRMGVIKEIIRIQQFALVVVVSNQQCIGKELVSWEEIKKINRAINQSLVEGGGRNVDFFVCPHLEEVACECRKPKPGLLLQAINQFRNGDNRQCLFVGDHQVDLIAASQAGVKFRFVESEAATIQLLSRILQLGDFSK